MDKNIMITITKEYYDNMFQTCQKYEELGYQDYLFKPQNKEVDIFVMTTKDGAIKKLIEQLEGERTARRTAELKLQATTERLMRIDFKPKKWWQV
jgi:hypothetical protein